MELHIRCLPQSKHPTSESESGSVVSDCDPMDDTVHNTGVGSLSPSPGDLPNPGIEPGSSALQADSLPTEANKTALRISNVLSGSLVRKRAQSRGPGRRVRKLGCELRVSDSLVLSPLL